MSFNLFDGRSKQKRNISLGGVAKTVDKRNLVQKTQNERQARVKEKKRQQSATLIQAFYRGRRSAAETRARKRLDFLQTLASFQSLLSSHDTDDEDVIPVLFELVSSFLLFYQPGHIEDDRTSVKLCEVLLRKTGGGGDSGGSGDGGGPMVLILPFEEEKEEHWNRWASLLWRLGHVMVAFVGRCYGAASLARVTPPLVLLAHLTNQQTYTAVTVKEFPSHEIFQQTFSHLLHGARLYSNLRGYLLTLQPTEDKNLPTVATAITIALSPFKSSMPTRPEILDAFIFEILSIPLLPNRVAINSVRAISKRMPLEEVVLHLGKKMNTAPLEGASLTEFVLPLLANILAFGYQRVSEMTTRCWTGYVDVLSGLLARIPTGILGDDRTDDVGRLEEEEEEDDDEKDGEDVKMTASQKEKLDLRLQNTLNLLYDSDHLSSLLWFLKPKPSSEFESQSIEHLANYLASLLLKSPSSKSSILKQLIVFNLTSTTSPSSERTFIQLLWTSFKGTQLYPLLKGEGSARRGSAWVVTVMDDCFGRDWAVLWILGELINRVLIVAGDDEFFDDSKNNGGGGLGMQETSAFIEILRNVTFTLYWHETLLELYVPLKDTSLTPMNLRITLTKVAQQLHARHSRRPFTPPGHWLVEDLEIETFIRSISEEDDATQDMTSDSERNEEYHQRGVRRVGVQSRSNNARHGVFQHVPFVIPFEDRVRIFRQYIKVDRARNHVDDFGSIHNPARGAIRRQSVFEDGFDSLNALGPNLKKRVSISFVDKFGLPEAGIDGGGVFKEFLTALALEAFNINYGLFLSTRDQLLYPNPHSIATEPMQLRYFEFLGRIIGKALYEGILVDVAFAGFFLCKWLGRYSYLDDLPSLDPELYQGLIFLKNYQGDIEDLALNFTIANNEFDKSHIIELIPNGANIPVTESNKIRYIYLTAHHRLNTQIDRQCKAFFRGLKDLIEPRWLKMFNQQELQIMLGGAAVPINISDLQANTLYNGFTVDDPTIRYLWRVVEEMTEDQRRKFVKFVTSCARPPLLGFSELNPTFCIRCAGDDEERLPTSSTCVNLLKLPKYSRISLLRKKLLYAINAEAGFDLS